MACPRKHFFVGLCLVLLYLVAESAKSKTSLIQQITDPKEFKKFLRTHTNVLVLFAKSNREVATTEWDTLAEVALQMKGIASIVYVDCSAESKPCKKLKSSPKSFELKHYKDGDYHKSYDRKLTVQSMSNFLRNPTGDAPWEEDSDAGDVIHVNTREEFVRLISKEKKPMLVMFYAPWCGHCKRLKPEFAAAATELKGTAVLVGMDVDKPENYVIRTEYNITGFPTLCYFENSKFLFRYGGENNKEGIITWLRSPAPPAEAAKEPDWSELDNEVVHLTEATFDEHISTTPSVLVMFYAPWCGHCKKMKPEYEKAATQLKVEQVAGSLAAVDATKEPNIAKRYDIKGYPTVKYFKDGKYAWEVNERTADKIVSFMLDPREPPPTPPEEIAWETIPSSVVHLDGETFKPFTKKKKHVLVMFYAPWCGHCKKAKPEFTSAAEVFSDSKVAFAAVDCTKHSALCQSNDVSGYPTFKYFNYGKNDIKYTGGREKEDFIRFMNDPLSPLSLSPPKPSPEEQWQELDSAQNIYHLTEKTFDVVLLQQKAALVLFYAPWCGHCKAMKPAFAKAAALLKADKFDGILAAVDVTTEKSLQTRFNIEGFPTIKYFTNGIEALTYESGRQAEDFVAFMKSRLQSKSSESSEAAVRAPSQLHNSAEFSEFIKNGNCLVMFYAMDCANCKSLMENFNTVSEQLVELSADWHLATVNCTEKLLHDVCGTAANSNSPVLRYFRDGQYIIDYTGNGTVQDVLQFVKIHNIKKDEL